MKRRIEMGILAVLAVTLGWVLYTQVLQSPSSGAVGVFAPVDRNFTPLAVPDPDLRVKLIDDRRKQEYTGTQRDIFTFAPEPRPEPVADTTPGPVEPPQPVEPAVPLPPFRYYGYADYLRTGLRRGFFTNGEEIWVASEGEILLGRYRIVRLGANDAVVEDQTVARQVTLTMEGAPPG